MVNFSQQVPKMRHVKAVVYALVYVLLAGLWILFSGKAVVLLIESEELRNSLEIYKGWFFVLLTGIALYVLLRSWQSEMHEELEWRGTSYAGRFRLPTLKLPVIYVLCLVLIVASGGYVAFEQLKRSELHKVEQNLSAVAQLKVTQIGGWLKQSIDFAGASGDSSNLANHFERWVRDGKLSEEHVHWVRTRLDILRHSNPYSELTLYDLNGKSYLSTGMETFDALAHVPDLFRQVIESKRPAIGPMHWHDGAGGSRYVSFPMAAPLMPSGANGSVVGVLMFELNPEKHLFPTVESWPTSSPSSETMLVQISGEDAVFLSDLKHKKGSSLTRMNLKDNPTQLSAQAAKGKTGFISGTDYRGVAVMGYVQKIPNTEWIMIAKLDADEVELPIRRLAFEVALAVFLLALVGGLSLYFWWRQRKARYETAQLASEWHQKMLENQVTFLSKYANDIILLMDDQGSIIEANDRAETAYLCSRSELIGLNIREFRQQDEWPELGEQLNQVRQGGSNVFAATHCRRDGSEFPVEVSSRLIEDERGVFIQSIIRDITERKQLELREQRLKNTLRVTGEINGAIMRMEDASALYPMVCRIVVEFGGMALAWVGVVDESGTRIVPAARAGRAAEHLDAITVVPMPDRPEGQGPVATTYRSKRIVVVNDFQKTEITSPWHAVAIEHGLNSMATFPIFCENSTCAVLAVYSEQVGAFDDEIVKLLERTVQGVSFALDNFEREVSRRKSENALRKTEARFRMVIDQAPFPMQIVAEDGEILLLNRAWTEITGYTLTDIPTIYEWTEMACGEGAAKARENIIALFKIESRRDSQEYNLRCKDGSYRQWYFVTSPSVRLDDGRKTVIGVAVDVTERRKVEEDLLRAATVFENSHSSIMITDGESRIVAVNPAFSTVTGYSEEEVIGQTPNFLKSDRQDANFYHGFWRSLLQDGFWQGEIWNRRKTGEEYASWLSITAMRDENGSVLQYIGMADDITESKESQSRIEFLAYHDALTGLPNRMLANDRLEQAIAHAHRSKTRVAVMFLDLDDFKTINDTLGHSVGDSMLKAVADRLRHCLRDADSVSRQGGDEFLVMLNDVADIDSINNVAVDILEKIHKPYIVEEHDLSISTSIGIAIYPEDGLDCETLLKNADMAMYNAKQSGRNTHRFFAEEMNDYVLEHLLIRNGLVRALENKEFLLHYQPQLDLAKGKLVGAEALIRWQHPELGMVPPNRFIQIAEESGMIIPIGNWVIQEACRQAMAWQKAGWPGLVVGVNISALQFRRGDMEQIVSDALVESGLEPQFLELELTESILIQDVEKSLDTIQRLKMLGVRLSIDDFGTGYSSLAYLRRLPVDKLKIDQSFVRDITTQQDDAAIALSIITLAHTLQKKVIAEGVETADQLHFLREHNCDEIQGYLFSRPLSPDGFSDFLKRGVRMDFLLQG